MSEGLRGSLRVFEGLWGSLRVFELLEFDEIWTFHTSLPGLFPKLLVYHLQYVKRTSSDPLKSNNGEIKAGSPVTKILIKNNKSYGLVLENGDEIYADKIVSNLDVKRTFLKVVEKKDLPEDFKADALKFMKQFIVAQESQVEKLKKFSKICKIKKS